MSHKMKHLLNFTTNNNVQLQTYKNILTSAQNRNFVDLVKHLNMFVESTDALKVIYNTDTKIIDEFFDYSLKQNKKVVPIILNCVTKNKDLEKYLIKMYSLQPGPYFYNVISNLEIGKILSILFSRTVKQWKAKYYGFYKSLMTYLKNHPILEIGDFKRHQSHCIPILKAQYYYFTNLKPSFKNINMDLFITTLKEIFDYCFIKVTEKTLSLYKKLEYPFTFEHELISYILNINLGIPSKIKKNIVLDDKSHYFKFFEDFISDQFFGKKDDFLIDIITILQSCKKYDRILKLKLSTNEIVLMLKFEIVRKESSKYFLKKLLKYKTITYHELLNVYYLSNFSKHTDLFLNNEKMKSYFRPIYDMLHVKRLIKYGIELIKEESNKKTLLHRLDIFCENVFECIHANGNYETIVKKLFEMDNGRYLNFKDLNVELINKIKEKLNKIYLKLKKYEPLLKSQFLGRFNKELIELSKLRVLQAKKEYDKITINSRNIERLLQFEIYRKERNLEFLERLKKFKVIVSSQKDNLTFTEVSPNFNFKFDDTIKGLIRMLRLFLVYSNEKELLGRIDYLVKHILHNKDKNKIKDLFSTSIDWDYYGKFKKYIEIISNKVKSNYV